MLLILFSFVHKTEEEGNTRSDRRLIKGPFVFLFTFQRSLFRAMGEHVYSLHTKEENISLLSSAHSPSRSSSTAFQLHPPYLTSKLQDKTHLHVSSNLTSHLLQNPQTITILPSPNSIPPSKFHIYKPHPPLIDKARAKTSEKSIEPYPPPVVFAITNQ